MLIFAKLSLMSFIYDMLKTFCFPDEKVQKNTSKIHDRESLYFHVLTDTDSICLKFLFVSKPDSAICENKYRGVIFEIIIASELYNRSDTSHKHWEKFDAR